MFNAERTFSDHLTEKPLFSVILVNNSLLLLSLIKILFGLLSSNSSRALQAHLDSRLYQTTISKILKIYSNIIEIIIYFLQIIIRLIQTIGIGPHYIKNTWRARVATYR